ncbi:MAG: MFS transporter [Hyphomicrobiales bacterium]|nr:MFS transporter [Hyphomicrobiales bacterium]
MNIAEFRKAGHWPTLLAAFLYFDISFMAWVSLGPLITFVAHDLHLSVPEKFSILSIPVLSGALLRVPLGILADTIGSKRTGVGAQTIVLVATVLVALLGLPSEAAVKAFALVLGLGGASFAVALPQASRWYPPKYQGVVMGIAGAGNMGVVLDTLFGPSLAAHYGWQAVFGVLLVPMAGILAYYIYAVKDAPGQRARPQLATYTKLLGNTDALMFMLFYFITFGGFVGLANTLPLYFTVQYHLSPVAAGLLVSLIVALGSGFRPVGGAIADRIGGVRALSLLFGVVVVAYGLIALLPADRAVEGALPFSLATMPAMVWPAVLLFSIGVLALGMGNGAVFQLIPLRFGRDIGVLTGLVGCAGGLGGFFLAKTLGLSKGMTGGFGPGFLFFAGLAAAGCLALFLVKHTWRTTWGATSGARV